MSRADDDDMEIVVVSDTVRQRRSRTPISAIPSDANRESNVVMPDLLPKMLQLSEISSFSDASVGEMQSREVDAGECSMVEITEHNLSTKILIKNISFEDPKVDTISVFESCLVFEPEQVETVLIIDASSDTDTASSTPQLNRKSMKSNGSNCGSMDELKTELKRELDTVFSFETVEEPVEDFSVKKQRISFNEHTKSLKGKDRDVLRDSEMAEEKAIKLMKLRPTLKELWMEERNSFYGPDDDNDEPLEFSDDEEIPRYSIEMDSDSDAVAAFANNFPLHFSFKFSKLLTKHFSYNFFRFPQSRIETPNNSKVEPKDKETSFSLDDSFTSASPLTTSSPFTYKSMTPLDQRVDQFEKTARYMMKKLDQTLQQIQTSDVGISVIEHMKLSVAPDAALILSQGDTLILETHGKNSGMTHRLQTVQKELRNKYKDVQNSNTTNNLNLLEKNHNLDPENQNSPKEKVFADKKFPLDLYRSTSTSSIKVEDLVAKVLKRVKDLIAKPVELSSEDELTKRILDIGVSLSRLLSE